MKPLNFRRVVMIAAVFLLGMAFRASIQAETLAVKNPIIGTWRWTLFNGKCTETLQYRSDGVALSTSAQAVSEWRYAATAAADAQGFYKIVEISTRHNSKKDCAGDVLNGDGVEADKYIQFSPAKDMMIVCKSATLSQCYGPLRRMP